jgi:hypothetical protein
MKYISPENRRLSLQARLLLATLVPLGLSAAVFVLLHRSLSADWLKILVLRCCYGY